MVIHGEKHILLRKKEATRISPSLGQKDTEKKLNKLRFEKKKNPARR